MGSPEASVGRIQVAAEAVQARRVREIGELDLAGLLRRGLVRLRVADGAVLRDGDRLRVGGNRDLRLERVAVAGHHVAVAIEMERAGSACRRVRPTGRRTWKKPRP